MNNLKLMVFNMLSNFARIAVISFFCCIFIDVSDACAQGGGSKYVSGGNVSYGRKSTDAQRKTMPRTGKGATSLNASNPYEKRKVDLIADEKNYQEALQKWEAKVAQKEMKDRDKQMKFEAKRQKALQAERDRQAKEAARLARPKKESGFNLFGSSTPKSPEKQPTPVPPVVMDSTQASYQQETELELPRPSVVQQGSADAAAKTTAEPGFFTKLKWALFGK